MSSRLASNSILPLPASRVLGSQAPHTRLSIYIVTLISIVRWETEAQRDKAPCLGVHSWESVEAGLDRAILFQSTLSYSLGTPVPHKLHLSYCEFLCPSRAPALPGSKHQFVCLPPKEKLLQSLSPSLSPCSLRCALQCREEEGWQLLHNSNLQVGASGCTLGIGMASQAKGS